MSAYNGQIMGTVVNGSLTTTSKGVTIYSIGYDLNSIPLYLNGKTMGYQHGLLLSHAELVNIYRWGTWRIVEERTGDLIGYLSSKYPYGERISVGIPYELNLIVKAAAFSNVQGFGLAREGKLGLRTRTSGVQKESVIKVHQLKFQDDLVGRTWGDWLQGGHGNLPSKRLRPRKFPDTHIPRRREDL